MPGIGATLAANSNIQGTGAAVLTDFDAAINALAGAAGVGGAVSIVDTVLGFLNPTTPPQGPSIQDLINGFNQFTKTVINELNSIHKTDAGGRVQQWAHDLNAVLLGQGGPLGIISELNNWKNDPGLPLPDNNYGPAISPSACQMSVTTTLSQLLGAASTPVGPPTSYWNLPEGDLPLFNPDNPWTYAGPMFNEACNKVYPYADTNPYESYESLGGDPSVVRPQKVLPQFDFSALQFTNDFTPPPVPGVLQNNAFNPTWILQVSMAAVQYYFLVCGAVLKNFPDDATVHSFVGNDPHNPADFNFLGELSWYHDQIRAGIVCIWPPFPTALVPVAPGNVSPNPNYKYTDGVVAASADSGISWWSNPCMIYRDISVGVGNPFGPYSYSFLSQLANPSSQWKRPFGALCSYNGFVAGYGGPRPSVDSYPNYVYPTPGDPIYSPEISQFATPVADFDWYNGFYCKYLVACLWRAKMVYNGMALGDMWRTINRLYVLFGQPPRPGPCFGDWSLSEVFRMLGSANYDTFPLSLQPRPGTSGSKFTVRAFLQFMSGAAPTSKTPLTSLRAALQGV